MHVHAHAHDMSCLSTHTSNLYSHGNLAGGLVQVTDDSDVLMRLSIWQVNELEAINIELDDANTRLEAMATNAERSQASLREQLEALQRHCEELQQQVPISSFR